ncbi:hypothetical protein HQN88_25365 [Paenibacillus qinlingensis]|uniref:hypothetical protein n=1 Tax=Paenibacillus qinlingensis TaxID=1837343 RepID=UPI002367CD52|nr:hypothetical protein [Paenibacillus qinlingensis]NQX62197.1 hypothetical protein [Paenibacillus qinlingensis]
MKGNEADLYKSVIRDKKFFVLVVDGVYETSLMELPTEGLADKVAYELQTAWDQGVDWGAYQKQREIDNAGSDKEMADALQKIRSMDAEEREALQLRKNKRFNRIQKVVEARRWRNVLSWKTDELK